MSHIHPDADTNVIVVIQCAASKQPYAGNLKSENGQPVLFVANPEIAPKHSSVVYKRPDDPANSSQSYRDIVIEYNRDPADNPLKLLPAWQLYKNPVYGQLVQKIWRQECVYSFCLAGDLFPLTSLFPTTTSHFQKVRTPTSNGGCVIDIWTSR